MSQTSFYGCKFIPDGIHSASCACGGGAVLDSDETSAVYAALSAGNVTNTGLAYQEYSQPGPPTLNLTQTSAGSLSLG